MTGRQRAPGDGSGWERARVKTRKRPDEARRDEGERAAPALLPSAHRSPPHRHLEGPIQRPVRAERRGAPVPPCPAAYPETPGGGTVTVNPPVLITDCPSGFVTVTSRAPGAAVDAIAIATDSCVDETTVVELTVTPAPKEALAPAWKFVPVTVTVRLAPGVPEVGDRLAIVGTRSEERRVGREGRPRRSP